MALWTRRAGRLRVGNELGAVRTSSTDGVKGGAGRQMSRGKAPVKETRSRARAVTAPTQGMARAELAKLIGELTDQMLAAARELQFELAARFRDEIAEMKKELRQMDAAGAR